MAETILEPADPEWRETGTSSAWCCQLLGWTLEFKRKEMKWYGTTLSWHLDFPQSFKSGQSLIQPEQCVLVKALAEH